MYEQKFTHFPAFIAENYSSPQRPTPYLAKFHN